MRDKAYEIKMGLAAVALAGSIWGTAHSCSSYSDAMKALNANPDYVQSEILEDAADNLSSASSELEYSILGIIGTGAFGGYTVYRHKEDTGFFW